MNHRLSEGVQHLKSIFELRNILIAGMFIISLYVALKTSLMAALVVTLFLAVLPFVLSDVKTFFVILIAFKMVINGLYNVYIFSNINILQVIGAFVPIFLIFYMLVKKINIKTYPFFQLMIIFVAEVILGSIFTIYETHSLGGVDKLLRLLNGLTCYFAIPFIFSSEKDIKLYLKAWFVSLSFPLLLGLYQTITGQLHFQVQGELYRVAGIYHDVGTIAFSGIFFILLLFFFYNNFNTNTRKIIFYFLLALVSYIVYRTYSRTTAITMAVVFLLFSLYKRKIILFLSTAIVVLGIFLSESSGIYQRFELDITKSEQFGNAMMFMGRVGIWERNWDKYVHYSPVQKLFGYEAFGAHNDFLRVLLDNGFLGFILYTAILVLILVKLLKTLKFEEDLFYKNLIFIAFLSQIGFILTCFSTTPSLYTDYQWFHWGLVGIALVQAKIRGNTAHVAEKYEEN